MIKTMKYKEWFNVTSTLQSIYNCVKADLVGLDLPNLSDDCIINQTMRMMFAYDQNDPEHTAFKADSKTRLEERAKHLWLHLHQPNNQSSFSQTLHPSFA